jgi:hypothetical protein
MVIPEISLTVMNSKVRSCPSREVKPLGSVNIPYMKGVYDKFICLGNLYDIRMIFKTKHIISSSLTKTRPERDRQQKEQCLQHFLCDRSYIGEIGRLLAMWLHEHRHNFKECLIDKSKLSKHAYRQSSGMKLGFWKLKATAGIGNTRN